MQLKTSDRCQSSSIIIINIIIIIVTSLKDVERQKIEEKINKDEKQMEMDEKEIKMLEKAQNEELNMADCGECPLLYII